MPGYYEQQAVQAATSAQELSPDPAQLCRAHLALGRAYVALYNLKLGSEVADSDMWLDHDQSAAEAVEVAADAAKVSGLACLHRIHLFVTPCNSTADVLLVGWQDCKLVWHVSA